MFLRPKPYLRIGSKHGHDAHFGLGSGLPARGDVRHCVRGGRTPRQPIRWEHSAFPESQRSGAPAERHRLSSPSWRRAPPLRRWEKIARPHTCPRGNLFRASSGRERLPAHREEAFTPWHPLPGHAASRPRGGPRSGRQAHARASRRPGRPDHRNRLGEGPPLPPRDWGGDWTARIRSERPGQALQGSMRPGPRLHYIILAMFLCCHFILWTYGTPIAKQGGVS